MALNLLLLCQKIHGHVAVLGVALCFHPWLALRRADRPSPRARLAGYLAAAALFASSAMGWSIYPAYRREVKQRLYLMSGELGLAFEVKEHLAWFALVLAASGAVQLACARGDAAKGIRHALRATWLSAALLATASVVLGLVVSSALGFGNAGD